MLTTHRLLAALLAASAAATVSVAAQDQALPSLPPDHPPAYPLLCRGGGPFAFDTLRQMDGVPIIEVAMTFTPAASAALSNGTGLAQGTCAWVDRPLNAEEPTLIWFTMPISGVAGPQNALRDPGSYWRFLVHNTGQGHLESDAHAAWTLEAPVTPWRPSPSWFLYLAVFVSIAFIPTTWMAGRLSAWSRLAERYPEVSGQRGRWIRCGFLVLGRATHKGIARLTVDSTHLHVSVGFLFRPGYPTFSVPWSDITATREEWRWSLPPVPVVRLTFARDPEIRFLIRPRVAEEVIAASGGALLLLEQPVGTLAQIDHTHPPRPGSRTAR